MKEIFRNIQYKNFLFPILAVLLALFISAIIVSILGYDWWLAYQNLLQGSVGNLRNIGETITRATPLIFTGLSFAIGRRCGLINLGAEGQVFMGGLFATFVGVTFTGLPTFIHLPLAILAGMVGGGLLGLLIGWLKNRFGASELITGIMFNYISILLVGYFVSTTHGPLRDRDAFLSQSARMPDSAMLPRILEGTRIHAGIFIALLALFFFYVFLWKTTKGYEIRAAGLNPDAARYSGIKVKHNILLAMFMAGGFAGLAGSVETLGVHLRLLPDFSANFGFDGIAVSLLGNNTPVGILLSAVLFGMLRSGAQQMQMAAQVPVAAVQIIQSLVILFVVGRELYTHVIGFFKKVGLFIKKGVRVK
jgi:simple sugar transport system permease protein